MSHNPQSAIRNPQSENPKSTLHDVQLLRILIRRTYREMRRGTLDPENGGRLVARASTALATLLNTHHRINPPEDEVTRMRAKIDDLWRAIGWGEEEDPDPNSTF
jgi:hypothetical protein